MCAVWAQRGFPENKKENRGSPALCVSGNFQGKQRVFGAPFWKLASFPESESWSGAKSEAKLRKSTKYPGGRRVNSRYARVFRKIPGILPNWPKIWLILGPNQPQTRLRAQNLTISTEFSREKREEKRGCCREKRKGKETGCERKSVCSLIGSGMGERSRRRARSRRQARSLVTTRLFPCTMAAEVVDTVTDRQSLLAACGVRTS